MRVRILRDRYFTPGEGPRVTVAYKAGSEVTVKRGWGEALVAGGDAEEIDAPGRPEAKRELTPAQIKALDRDEDGAAGGSLPKGA